MLAALAMFGLQAAVLPSAGVPHAPDDEVTTGASIAIVRCLEMRESQATRAGFIAGVPGLSRRLAADPRLAGVTIDNADGRGCRVSFTGSAADADLMAARAGMTPNQLLFTRRPLPTGGELISTTLIDPRP